MPCIAYVSLADAPRPLSAFASGSTHGICPPLSGKLGRDGSQPLRFCIFQVFCRGQPAIGFVHQLLYKKISENVDEFIIIDIDKIQLKLFKDSFLDRCRFPHSARDKFKNESDFISYLKTLLPPKCKFYQPIDLKEFDQAGEDKIKRYGAALNIARKDVNLLNM